MAKITPIELEIFKNLFNAICEEMGVVLGRSAFSPNIKERKDFSCALFDAKGNLIAQAAHIPVHLGSMPLSVAAALRAYRIKPGDAVILNDPYRGGTHLPDITLVAPIFVKTSRSPQFFAANRAHHSDVGGKSPGSMPLAKSLEQEGVVIPPTLFYRRGKLNRQFLSGFLKKVRHPEERRADLAAQQSANAMGVRRFEELVQNYGLKKIFLAIRAYQKYEEQITRQALRKIPPGTYRFTDCLDDDGIGDAPVPITAAVRIAKGRATVDFRRSSPQVLGPVNATFAITLSAVAYVFRCLTLSLTGEDCLSLKPIRVLTRKGSAVDARYPAPVAGGNVETSQRIVDVLFGALAKALPAVIPAASQGTMNNVAMGSNLFSYYETLGGGMGARPASDGLNAIHTHMTNTLNTPVEALETTLPLRVTAYRIRRRSGGAGRFRGGHGLIREYQFLQDTQISLLTDRRISQPYGLKNGKPGTRGANWLILPSPPFIRPSIKVKLPSKLELKVIKGTVLRIETPGGGGFGKK